MPRQTRKQRRDLHAAFMQHALKHNIEIPRAVHLLCWRMALSSITQNAVSTSSVPKIGGADVPSSCGKAKPALHKSS